MLSHAVLRASALWRFVFLHAPWILSVLVALVGCTMGYFWMRRGGSAEAEKKWEVEKVLDMPETQNGGMLSFFSDILSAFGPPVTTGKDVLIQSPETLYYLISGQVEIHYKGVPVLTRHSDCFLMTIGWLAGDEESCISFRIGSKSVFYAVNNWRDLERVQHVLLHRFFRGSLYAFCNYLEHFPESFDVKRVGIPQDLFLDAPDASPISSCAGNGKEKKPWISREACSALGSHVARVLALPQDIERVEPIECSGTGESIEVVPGTLCLVLSGHPTALYAHTSLELIPGDIIGCVGRTTPLEKPAKLSGTFRAVRIVLDRFAPFQVLALQKIACEFMGHVPAELALTDALIRWKILHPGEKVTSVKPRPVITLVSNGYFLKEGDVKYFGVGSGRILFEKEAMLQTPAENVVVAARISEVVEVPAEYVEFVARTFPEHAAGLHRRMLQRTGEEQQLDRPAAITFISNDPVSTQIDTFAHFLNLEINKNDTSTVVSSGTLEKKMGDALRDPTASISLALLLGSLQSEFSFVLLPITTPINSAGGSALRRLAEIMFCVMLSGTKAEIEIERAWCKVDTVIIHRGPRKEVVPGRYHGQRHHVQFPKASSADKTIREKTPGKDRVELDGVIDSSTVDATAASLSSSPSFSSADLERFLRTLKGENVGLVLGGGGARGIAHIGIIQALEEAGVRIDAVGGTSMGAFVGALYAETCNNKDVFLRAKKLCAQLGSVWQIFLDITYPICSMFTGKSFNSGLKSIFKGKQIEDLWLPYYCVTTDISVFEEKVHRFGPLWKYVRASMSLSGYLPPVCDGSSLLLDGGYVNNVPADAMRDMGIRKIIVVDVGSEVESNYDSYGDSLNGFYILFQKIFGTKRFLSLTEIQYRLAYLTSMHKERWLRSDVSIKYLRPDLAPYKTMDFRQFDEIVAHGYQYGKKVVAQWKQTKEYAEISSFGQIPGSSGA